VELFRTYQDRAKRLGIDPFGYNYMPYAYAAAQVLGMAVEATGSLDHAKIADYMRQNSFNTVVGSVTFGMDGEWRVPRMLVTQWQNLTSGDLAQLVDPKKWVVVWPPEHKTGEVIYPYAAARR